MLLLHLSDIHFRDGEAGTAMDPYAHIRAELLRDAADQCGRIGAAPDAVLITGDLAFAGQVDEYGFAQQWLTELCAACGTSLDKIFMVPGNHDVVRADAGNLMVQSLHRSIKAANELSLEGTIRSFLTDKETGPLLYKPLANYNNFASQFFCDLRPPDRTKAQRDLILNDGSILRLVGFNSAFVSSAADVPPDLFVDPSCLQLVRERGVEYVTLCHHPYSWLRQGQALRDHLNDVARLHLFGHEHVNRIDPARDYVAVAASAAHPEKTERGWEPGYNLIELMVEGEPTHRRLNVTAHVRVWQVNPGVFRAKVDRGGEPAFRQTIDLDPWSPPPVTNTPPHAIPAPAAAAVPESADSMDPLRELNLRFFKLTISQKAAIAGKLELLEEEDADQPEYERARRMFVRARERGLVDRLTAEIDAVLPRTV